MKTRVLGRVLVPACAEASRARKRSRKLHSRLYEGSVGPRPRPGDLHCPRPPARVADREEKRVTKETCNSIKKRAVTRRSPQISAPTNECGHSFKPRPICSIVSRIPRKKQNHTET